MAIAGTPAVLKLYGRKRDWLRDALRGIGQRWFVGKTGMSPTARCTTERETLALWRSHGFDVPAALDLPLPAAVPSLRLLLECLEGELLHRSIARRDVPLAEKIALLERLAADWGRRHVVAQREREPRLIQAHAMLGHVFRVPAAGDGAAAAERLVTFDFEVAWARRSALPRLISLEIAQLLESVAAWGPLEQLPALIAAFVNAYPDRAVVERLAVDVRRGPLPLFAWINGIALQLRERGPRRKRAVLRHVETALKERPE
ncbi:MAG: hypothetical protein EXR73_00600 [Myxococcales bacterium]|nr:hypothetical protein [Myxococcales bacterium]